MTNIVEIETEFDKVYRTNLEWYKNAPETFKIMVPGILRHMINFPIEVISADGVRAIEKLIVDLSDEVAFHYDRLQTWYASQPKSYKAEAASILRRQHRGSEHNSQAAELFINFLEHIRTLGPMKPFE